MVVRIQTSPVLPLLSPRVSQSLHPAPLLTILSNMPPSALIQAIPLLMVSLFSKFQFSYQISLFALTSLHRISLGSIALCHTEVPGLVLGLLECWWGGKGLVSLWPCLTQTPPVPILPCAHSSSSLAPSTFSMFGIDNYKKADSQLSADIVGVAQCFFESSSVSCHRQQWWGGRQRGDVGCSVSLIRLAVP